MWLRSCAVRQILPKVLSKFANEARQGIGSFEKTTKCTATIGVAMHSCQLNSTRRNLCQLSSEIEHHS